MLRQEEMNTVAKINRKEAVDDVCAAMSKLAVLFCFGSATDWYKYIYGWYHCAVVKTSMEQHKPDVTCLSISTA